MSYTYEQLQKTRQLLISELNQVVPQTTIEKLTLVEMRLQSIIMAKLNEDDIKDNVPTPVVDKG